MNTVTQIKRPVLRYHGGKFMLAEWVISHFPEHRVYVEPYGGAASVLMRKPRAFAETYNDQWSTVVNVFRVLRDPGTAAALERMLRLTPFAREEFEADWPADGASKVELARRTILRSFAGFGSASVNGAHSTGFRASSRRQYTIPAHDWARYPEHIQSFVDRLSGVVIEHRPALDVIAAHDGADSLFYVDPPYPHETRNMRRGNAAYAHEMSNADHEAMAQVLESLKGMVVLSGYRCAMYDRLFAHWERRDSRALADGGRERTESLWLNLACAGKQRQHQMALLSSTTSADGAKGE